jgi:hypothetical protein
LADPGQGMHIQERVFIRFGVDDVSAVISSLLAIDQDLFGALRVGSLLYSDNLLPCFWSSIFKSEISIFEASVGNIQEPTLEGFISKGIDNIVTQSVKAAFLMYESVVIRALPNIFQTTVRSLVNEAFFHSYDGECPGVVETPGLIDFRDLLLDAEEAPALGGSGLEPYGDLASRLFAFVKTQLATLEDDGTLTANDIFIRPLTELQSGVEGLISMPGELFGISADAFDLGGFDVLLQGLHMSLSNLSLTNLDTLVPPLLFLEPTTEPYTLDNELNMGPIEGRPLNVTAHLSIYVEEGSPLAMRNEIEISLTSSAFQILAEVVARVEAMAFLNFPLSDLFPIQLLARYHPITDHE